MSARILREKYTREFVGMEKYARATGWVIVAGYVLQIVGAIAAGHYLLSLEPTIFTLIAVFLMILLIGTRLRGLNNIIHECSHATFSAHREDNTRIGKLCAALLLNSFTDYRDEHLSHHAHLGDYEHDLDLQGIEALRLHDPLTPRVFLRHLSAPLLGRHLPYYLGLNLSARDGRGWQVLKYALIGATSMFTAVYPQTAVVFLIVPYVLIFSSLNYWADCMDHAGLVHGEDDLDASRNMLAPSPLRWLFFPRNDCYHLVHHLFPHVPARHLGATHAVLETDDLYRSRRNAVRSRPSETAAIAAE